MRTVTQIQLIEKLRQDMFSFHQAEQSAGFRRNNLPLHCLLHRSDTWLRVQRFNYISRFYFNITFSCTYNFCILHSVRPKKLGRAQYVVPVLRSLALGLCKILTALQFYIPYEHSPYNCYTVFLFPGRQQLKQEKKKVSKYKQLSRE